MSLGPLSCHKESRLETSISQEVDIFKFLEENQRASFDPSLLGSGCPASISSSSILFFSIALTFHFIRCFFLPVRKNDDNAHEREVKYHRKKIPQGLIFS